MNIHIFNPDHEMALAADVKCFTPSHAARRLRHDLAYLPMLWAEEADYVLVDDPAACREAMRHLRVPLHGRLMSCHDFSRYMSCLSRETPVHIRPWGWNVSLRGELIRLGVAARWLPTEDVLEWRRGMSHRYWAARRLLAPLRVIEGTTGEVAEARSLADLTDCLHHWGDVVVKAPWSSSGRGVRYLLPSRRSLDKELTPSLEGWLRHVVERQGSVTVEPYYNKVVDFALEFTAHEDGKVEYCGLSLFKTLHGTYAGNVVDTEEAKWALLGRYVDLYRVRRVIDHLLQLLGSELSGHYVGPLGIDAMVVRASGRADTAAGHLLHPCVELNLRNTMGHVALAVGRGSAGRPRTMHISCGDKYRLQIMDSPLDVSAGEED